MERDRQLKAPDLDGVPEPPRRLPLHCAPTRHCLRDLPLHDPCALYIGRDCPARGLIGSRWQNPFQLAHYSRAECIRRYSLLLSQDQELICNLKQLAGRKLVCWCRPNLGCHADPIIEAFTERCHREEAPCGDGLRFLLLFSGPASRKDSLANGLRELGAEVDEFDILNDEINQDLLSEEVWHPVLKDCIDGRYDGGGLMPPCSTYSAARRNSGAERGPSRLRGPVGRDRYGLPHLSPADKEKVRIGTLLALRAAEAAEALHRCRGGRGSPWFFETPLPREGVASVFGLDETLKLDDLPSVRNNKLCQCMLGARTTKETAIKANFELDTPETCEHAARSWKVPWSGEEYLSPHPRLRGTQWALPAELWTEDMLRTSQPSGHYITRDAAAYPSAMNRFLAWRLVRAALDRKIVKPFIQPSTTAIQEWQRVPLQPKIRERWLLSLDAVNIPTSARQAVRGQGMCLGYTFSRTGARLGSLTGNPHYDQLAKILNGDLSELTRGGFQWSSVQVNLNTISAEHSDSGNKGLSLIVSLGQFTGGELVIDGHKVFDVRDNLLAFDGSKKHFNRPYEGKRYSLVFFTHQAVDLATPEEKDLLDKLGFHWRPTVCEPEAPASDFVKVGKFQNTLVRRELAREPPTGRLDPTKINWTGNLVGRPTFEIKETETEDDKSIGGMRHPRKSVDKIPDMRHKAAVISKILDDGLNEFSALEKKVLHAIDHAEQIEDADILPGLSELRARLARAVSAKHHEKISTEHYKTDIRGELLHAVGRYLGDPGADAARWTWEGAPAGISEDIPDWGIFPVIPNEEAEDFGFLSSDPYTFTNYRSMDDDPEAIEEVLSLAPPRGNFLASFDTLEECVAFLDDQPVLSRFALIVKVKDGKTKKRTILDAKQSGVTKSSRKMFRVILPRPTDAINDALDLLALCEHDETVDFLVLDCVDAFWNVPLRKSERRFFTGRLGGRYVVYLRTAQGSRAAPLTWALLISLVMRCSQAMFDPGRLRLQDYVDDPIAVIRGTPPSSCAMQREVGGVPAYSWLSFSLPQSTARTTCELDRRFSPRQAARNCGLAEGRDS